MSEKPGQKIHTANNVTTALPKVIFFRIFLQEIERRKQILPIDRYYLFKKIIQRHNFTAASHEN